MNPRFDELRAVHPLGLTIPAATAIVVALAALPAVAQHKQWSQRFGTSALDFLGGMAPDRQGGFFAGGGTDGNLVGPSAGSRDIWLTRYDAGGTPLWSHQLGSPDWDALYAAASDGSGGAFVAGYTLGDLAAPNAGSLDAWVAQFDFAGNPLWMRQFGAAGADWATAVAQDGSGGVFVAGTVDTVLDPFLTWTDCWLARHDAAGNQLWMRRFGVYLADTLTAAAPDGVGGVYLVGSTLGNLGGVNVGLDDAWIARYDAAGTRLWIRQFGTSSVDVAYAAAADAVGGVFVAGTTDGALAGPHLGNFDGWLVRFDAAGNPTWLDQLGSGYDDEVLTIASDGFGGLFAAGSTDGSLGGIGSGSQDLWIARYDSLGQRLWIHQSSSISTETVKAAARDGSGGVFLGAELSTPTGWIHDLWLARFD